MSVAITIAKGAHQVYRGEFRNLVEMAAIEAFDHNHSITHPLLQVLAESKDFKAWRRGRHGHWAKALESQHWGRKRRKV
jgi:hypothetical protein